MIVPTPGIRMDKRESNGNQETKRSTAWFVVVGRKVGLQSNAAVDCMVPETWAGAMFAVGRHFGRTIAPKFTGVAGITFIMGWWSGHIFWKIKLPILVSSYRVYRPASCWSWSEYWRINRFGRRPFRRWHFGDNQPAPRVHLVLAAMAAVESVGQSRPKRRRSASAKSPRKRLRPDSAKYSDKRGP